MKSVPLLEIKCVFQYVFLETLDTCFLHKPQNNAIFLTFFFTLPVLQLISLPTGSLIWGIEDELLLSIRTNFSSDEIYLGYSAAIPGKLSDQLASWPPQRQPWCSQKTSIRQLQAGPDENNWQHLSLLTTPYLHHKLPRKHLRFKNKGTEMQLL